MTADGANGHARLALVRHGETVWHADNRYAGAASDIDLTHLGRRQAEDLAVWTAQQSFAAVVASPVRRALETAEPSARAAGVELTVVEDLREVNFGVAEGHTKAELLNLDADMVRRFHSDPVEHPYPGSEAPDSAARRAGDALQLIAEEYHGRSVLVVAHNTLLRLAMCHLLGLPVSRYRQLFPRLDNGAITELLVPTARGAPAALLSLNARPHPVPVDAVDAAAPTPKEQQ